MKKKSSCYMCGERATSREHVPPKCLFPEDANLRRNLITVPSCEAHNRLKSDDDELLRDIIAFAAPGNSASLQVVEGGIMRSWDLRGETNFSNLAPIRIGNDETATYDIDIERFNSSIQAIVRALFFADTRVKLLAELTVAWGALMSQDLSGAPFFEIIRRGERSLPPMKRGANPKVFQYDFHESNERTSALCRLRFYEGHPIYVTWKIACPPHAGFRRGR